MKFGTFCSGIGAPEVAWKRIGWTPIFNSEIEPFPCTVLNHYHPEVPNLGNMETITNETLRRFKPDVVCAGCPCQSFSVAGLREGMADPRGNLTLVFLRLLNELRPQWVVYENVPGLLSSNAGRDFGSFLGGLGKLGYGWAYRVLDAQYFGVPQRRRRVFVIGCLGDQQCAAAVLFERNSLSGNTAPSREAGQGFAHSIAPCIDASGVGFARTGDIRGQDPGIAIPDVVGTLSDGAHNGGGLNGQDAYSGRIIPVPECGRHGQAGFRDGDIDPRHWGFL